MGVLKSLSLSRPDDVAGKAWPAFVVGMFVAFGGVLFGCVEPSAGIRLINIRASELTVRLLFL